MNRMAKLAGIVPVKKVLLNEMETPGGGLEEIIARVYSLAEEAAYNDNAESGRGVSGEQISKHVEQLLKQIEDGAHEQIVAKHMSGQPEEAMPDESQGINQTE